jgi:hypothetical protein
VARGASGVGEWPLVDEHHVGPSQLGQMPNQTVADNACANDYALGSTWKLAHVTTPLKICLVGWTKA